MPLIHRMRRFGWGVADQGLSSLTNFALGIVVARTVGGAEFGAYSLTFATYTFGLGLVRSLAGETLSVRFSAVEDLKWRRATAWATGTSFTLALFFGIALLATGLLIPGALGPALIALGIFMPGLLLQDSWRFAFFAAGRGSAAFVNDLAWAILLIPALAIAGRVVNPSVSTYIAAWAIAASGAAALGALQARVVPLPNKSFAWLSEQRDIGPRFFLEFLAINGSAQISAYGIAALASLQAAGAIRGAVILMGPLYIFIMGLRIVAVPEGVRALERSTSHLWRRSLEVSAGLTGLAALWGLAVLLLPSSIGVQILGSTWDGTSAVLLPISISMLGLGATVGAISGLRALTAVRESLAARIIVALLNVATALSGAAIAGARGAAWGIAIAALAGAVVWWFQLTRAIAKHQPAPAR